MRHVNFKRFIAICRKQFGASGPQKSFSSTFRCCDEKPAAKPGKPGCSTETPVCGRDTRFRAYMVGSGLVLATRQWTLLCNQECYHHVLGGVRKLRVCSNKKTRRGCSTWSSSGIFNTRTEKNSEETVLRRLIFVISVALPL